MTDYPIDPQLKSLRHMMTPGTPLVLPFANFYLSLVGLMSPDVLSDTEAHVRRLSVASSDGGRVPLLIFEPRDAPATGLPCLVYAHGGGFMVKAASFHYSLARRYAVETPCKVVFVDYRRAPRHRFPVPVDDCLATYLWVMSNADALGIDIRRVAVGGDSSGACLAAATTLMIRDRIRSGMLDSTPDQGPLLLPRFQMLIYPVLDRRMATQSMERYDDTPLWNSRLNHKMWKAYLPQGFSQYSPEKIPYASPAEADDIAGTPSTYVETAEFDCLHDEGVEYAHRLQEGGVDVELNETRGTVHGFDYAQRSAIVQRSIERRCGALRKAFEA